MRVGGGRAVYGGGGGTLSVGRDARGTAGGTVPDTTTSGRDLNGGGGGPLVVDVDGRPEPVAGGGGARFQLGSQLALEEGTLEYRSRVLVTLVMPASLAFSALAFSSATFGCG